MAYVSNILWYVNSKRESVPSWISVKFYNWNTFLDEVRLNVWDVIPQNRIPIVSPSDIYYSWALWTYMDDSDPLRREKYTPTWSWFTLNWVAFDLTQPIKDNIRLVANVTSTTEYATKLTTVLMGSWNSTTTSDLWYIYTPNWTSISYQTFKDANVSIDFSQYWPYDDTASYTIWSNGSNNPFDPSYVWSDDWQSSTIFRSSNVNANVIVYIVQMTSATVTFTEYNNTIFVVWSDSTISIPKGSYFMTPELNNVQTPVNIPFKYVYYDDTPLTVKTVTLSPITSSGYSPYIYWIGIDTANFPSAENLEINIFVDRTIVAFGWGQAPTRVFLDCTYWTFKDANSLRYCGQYNIYGLLHINRNSSSQSLSRIDMYQYYPGTDTSIVTIEPEEWYRVKWVDIYNTSWEFTERVDNNNTNADVRSWKIMPYVVEYHWYPYYGFDSNYNNRTNLWWEWWMNSNQQFVSYASSTITSLTWIAPSSYLSMYWSYNELFYVEWLDNSWAVETQKMYCYMQTSVYASGVSKYAYFLVDVTSLMWTILTYTPYSKGVTVSSGSTLWQYIMSELMNWNWAWWTVDFLNQRDFYENSARDLYQTDSSKYNQKLNFYNSLKENIKPWYWSLEII